MYRRKRQARRSPLVAGLVAVGLVAAISGGIAFAWQKAEDAIVTASQEPEGTSYLVTPGNPASQADTASRTYTYISKGEGQSSPPLDAEAGEGANGAGESTQPVEDAPVAQPMYQAREQYHYAVPETPSMVDKEYFDDAIFFGDSLSVGIPLYGVMPNAKVIAVQGINTVSVNTQEVIDSGAGTRLTMLDAAKEHGDKGKVYIMLGSNGLGFQKEPFIEGYRTFLLSVKEQYPKASIYLQSMLPVTQGAHKNYTTVSNEKIDEYNLAIMELAKEQQVHYLDVAASMVDENGMLPDEASPSDGMHLSGPYYFKWFDYLRSHTVETT